MGVLKRRPKIALFKDFYLYYLGCMYFDKNYGASILPVDFIKPFSWISSCRLPTTNDGMTLLLWKRSISCRWSKFPSLLRSGGLSLAREVWPSMLVIMLRTRVGTAWSRASGFWLSNMGHLEGEKKYLSRAYYVSGAIHVIPRLVLKISHWNGYYSVKKTEAQRNYVTRLSSKS